SGRCPRATTRTCASAAVVTFTVFTLSVGLGETSQWLALLADRTAFIIAHRLSTVLIADRVLVVDGGRVVEDGTPKELIGGQGRFAALHTAWRESLA
ncbi:hypothetical protein K7G98_36985, partial [Saccharothrix sp. MB29]|nr:hypothetical protein [Saccharothrix sp. MB29]